MENSLFHDIYSNRLVSLKHKADEKRASILQAALNVILLYGFSRVTMDDIAKECGVSRPALYQFFKNKQEIYRATTRDMCDLSLEILKEELGKPGEPQTVLYNGIKFGLLDMMAQLAASTHGSELLEMKGDLSEDIIAEFILNMSREITSHFASVSKNKALPAETMALNLMLWLEGMKIQIHDPEERAAALRGFLAMQFSALGYPIKEKA